MVFKPLRLTNIERIDTLDLVKSGGIHMVTAVAPVHARVYCIVDVRHNIIVTSGKLDYVLREIVPYYFKTKPDIVYTKNLESSAYLSARTSIKLLADSFLRNLQEHPSGIVTCNGYAKLWHAYKNTYREVLDLNVEAKRIIRAVIDIINKGNQKRWRSFVQKHIMDYENLMKASSILREKYSLDQKPVPPMPAKIKAKIAIWRALEDDKHETDL